MSDNGSPVAQRSCPVCGDPVPSQPGAGRPNRYCSSKCKSRAARQRRIERELALKLGAREPDLLVIGEHLRLTRQLSREAAIDLVAGDPDALNAVLARVKPMIASPTHRATRWRDVAAMVSTLAAMIPED